MSLDFAARSYAANTQNLIWEHADLLKPNGFRYFPSVISTYFSNKNATRSSSVLNDLP